MPPLWLPGLVWSLGLCPPVRGLPAKATEGGPLQACAGQPCPYGPGSVGFTRCVGGDAVQRVAKRWQHCTASARHCRGAAGESQAWCAGSGKGGLSFSLQVSRWGQPLWLGLLEAVLHVASTPGNKGDHCILEALALASIPKPSGWLLSRCRAVRGYDLKTWITVAWPPSACPPSISSLVGTRTRKGQERRDGGGVGRGKDG